MKLIKNPWNELFYDLVRASEMSIKVTSPYVKENAVKNLFAHKKEKVSISLITSFKLMNYYRGASDLSALELILNKKGSVSNFQKLHSKIYIFDDRIAIISSGNLTKGGLVDNYEYGVLLEDESVSEVVGDFSTLLRNDVTGKITFPHISQAKEILMKALKVKSIVLPEIEIEKQNEEIEIFTGGVESIASTLKGWKLEVFNHLLKIPSSNFSLREVNSFLPEFRRKYPKNTQIEAKVRQQLQELRDLGLVEFLGKGRYRKLWY